jgi:tetratricopeptide (TPR) repeat protein
MAEKSVNDLPRELRPLFTKGSEALARDNYDYAIELFTQILAREPAIFDVRKALREAQLRKTGGRSGFFKKMLSNAGSSPLIAKGQLALRKDPAEALQVAEQILSSDPHNSPAHRLAVEAATAMGLIRTAVLSLEVLVSDSPKDRDVAIKFADALADTGEVVRAEKILADLSALFPTDQDLSLALKNISARKTMQKGGYEEVVERKGTFREILKDKEEAISLEQENRQVKAEDVTERLIKDYEARLQTDPNNLKLLRNMAELLTQKKQFERALSYYERIKASEGGTDPTLDRSIAEARGRQFDHQIAQLDPTAPDFPEQTAKLQADKQAFQLAECQKRAERFPTDLAIRFELGQLYYHAGKINEAIAEFQKARGNPHRKTAALNYLGQCFARKNMNDMAARTFEDALKEKLVFDDEKKEITYNLGSVLEKAGRLAEAVKHFESIFEHDINYRDVEKKVSDYHNRQGGAA